MDYRWVAMQNRVVSGTEPKVTHDSVVSFAGCLVLCHFTTPNMFRQERREP